MTEHLLPTSLCIHNYLFYLFIFLEADFKHSLPRKVGNLTRHDKKNDNICMSKNLSEKCITNELLWWW